MVNQKQKLIFRESKMAKVKRTNSATSALGGLLDTIKTVASVELKDNPEALAEVNKMVADTKDSNFMTMAEHADDSVETAHQVDEVLEQAGIDPVEHRRAGALAGANAIAEAEQANQIEEPIE